MIFISYTDTFNVKVFTKYISRSIYHSYYYCYTSSATTAVMISSYNLYHMMHTSVSGRSASAAHQIDICTWVADTPQQQSNSVWLSV